MLTLTQSELADHVLETLGVKAAGQSATAEDHAAAEHAIVSAYSRLRQRGLAPFRADHVPDWAWTPLENYVAADLAQRFGIGGERLQLLLASQRAAEVELARQVAGVVNVKVEAVYF